MMQHWRVGDEDGVKGGMVASGVVGVSQPTTTVYSCWAAGNVSPSVQEQSDIAAIRSRFLLGGDMKWGWCRAVSGNFGCALPTLVARSELKPRASTACVSRRWRIVGHSPFCIRLGYLLNALKSPQPPPPPLAGSAFGWILSSV